MELGALASAKLLTGRWSLTHRGEIIGRSNAGKLLRMGVEGLVCELRIVTCDVMIFASWLKISYLGQVLHVLEGLLWDLRPNIRSIDGVDVDSLIPLHLGQERLTDGRSNIRVTALDLSIVLCFLATYGVVHSLMGLTFHLLLDTGDDVVSVVRRAAI